MVMMIKIFDDDRMRIKAMKIYRVIDDEGFHDENWGESTF